MRYPCVIFVLCNLPLIHAIVAVVAEEGILTWGARQAELESSMMERSECLQQLQHLQKSEREAAAEALKHRQNLENLVAEKKALGDRVSALEADNAKLSAENVQVSFARAHLLAVARERVNMC